MSLMPLSPFAKSIRYEALPAVITNDQLRLMQGIGGQAVNEGGTASLNSQMRRYNPLEGRNQFGVAQRIGESDEDYNIRSGLVRDPNTRPANPFQNILSGLARTPARPANPFEGNEQYQALMEYQQSLAPSQEQQQRLQELQSAFEGTGAYKDYRINQLQNQLQQRQNPMMGMGLGSMRPMGMQPYQGFGRPQFPMQMPMQQPMPVPRGGYNQYQNQFGAMGYNQPQQQYMNPYQQMRPQPQQFGGYGMGQQMGGYGGYGQMPNPYQPQQFGYNPNNFMGYVQQQAMF
jgi:hypothetical protein